MNTEVEIWQAGPDSARRKKEEVGRRRGGMWSAKEGGVGEREREKNIGRKSTGEEFNERRV